MVATVGIHPSTACYSPPLSRWNMVLGISYYGPHISHIPIYLSRTNVWGDNNNLPRTCFAIWACGGGGGLAIVNDVDMGRTR